MKHGFWKDKWKRGEIGFHRDEVHPNLQRELTWFESGQSHHVLVPLCGKTHDLFFLAGRGHRVTGVELSSIACAAVFEREGVMPERSQVGPYTAWSGGGVTVLQGDFFALMPEHVPGVTRVWDRASMIALPPEMRVAYVQTIQRVLVDRAASRVLLNTLVYNAAAGMGPPFAVPDDEVHRAYSDWNVTRVLEDDQSDRIRPKWQERGVTELLVRLFRIEGHAVGA